MTNTGAYAKIHNTHNLGDKSEVNQGQFTIILLPERVKRKETVKRGPETQYLQSVHIFCGLFLRTGDSSKSK